MVLGGGGDGGLRFQSDGRRAASLTGRKGGPTRLASTDLRGGKKTRGSKPVPVVVEEEVEEEKRLENLEDLRAKGAERRAEEVRLAE